MARHYSIREFFRQIPNTLLARYFQAQGFFGDLNFSAKQRRERLKTRVRAEKAKGTKAFLKKVAEEEGISVSRLKQLVKE